MALAVKGALVGVIVVPDRNPEGLSQIHITAQGDAGIQQSIRKGAPRSATSWVRPEDVWMV